MDSRSGALGWNSDVVFDWLGQLIYGNAPELPTFEMSHFTDDSIKDTQQRQGPVIASFRPLTHVTSLNWSRIRT
jgi:hypothetical protein